MLTGENERIAASIQMVRMSSHSRTVRTNSATPMTARAAMMRQFRADDRRGAERVMPRPYVCAGNRSYSVIALFHSAPCICVDDASTNR